jgi:hypothetical protein
MTHDNKDHNIEEIIDYPNFENISMIINQFNDHHNIRD